MERLSYQQLEKLLEGVLKPGRYIGNETGIKSKDISTATDTESMVFTALVFPDIYEVGMSNLGMQILYDLINQNKDFSAERVFSPWFDLENNLIQSGLKLFSLENRIFLDEFDIIGISLQHELMYTNALNILRLGQIAIKAKDRKEEAPLICAGGPSCFNPLPMAPFVDFFVIGDGEEVFVRVLEILREKKKNRKSKKWFFDNIREFEGIFIPGDYNFFYNSRGLLEKIEPDRKVRKAVLRKIDDFDIVKDPVIANIKPVHDRFVCEIMRGCSRGCRFCQAGYIYRPVRYRNHEKLEPQCTEGIEKSGYDEISFLSLSSADYPGLEKLINGFTRDIKDKRISVSLPSMRLDSFSFDIARLIQSGRKTGLTFAPEAGSQSMRDAINKNIDKDEMLACMATAFSEGWEKVKLYFMIGFPDETEEDILAIPELVKEILRMGRELLPGRKAGRIGINLSINAFCPKPFTPFQWAGQDPTEVLEEKFATIVNLLPKKAVNVSWSDPKKSKLECAISRGDIRTAKAVENAFLKGARFDNWSEYFNFEIWEDAFKEAGTDMDFYSLREMSYDELLYWDFIDIGIKKDFLIKENNKAKELLRYRKADDTGDF